MQLAYLGGRSEGSKLRLANTMEDDRLETDIGLAAEIEEKEVEKKRETGLRQPKKRFVGRRTATATSASPMSPTSENSCGAVQGKTKLRSEYTFSIDIY